MSSKLLRRPLPPAKVDGHTSFLLNQYNQNISQITDQYPTLESKEDLQPLQKQILGNNKSVSPPPPNPPPSRVFPELNSMQHVTNWVFNIQDSIPSVNTGRLLSQFPKRVPRKLNNQGPLIRRLYKEESKFVSPPNNDIGNLIVTVSKMSHVSETYTKQVVYSKNTYQKITNLVAEKYFRQSSETKPLNVVHIPTEKLGEVSKRVPQRQLLIELAALIKNHMRETMKIDIHTVIHPLPRFQFGNHNKPETEIIIYQQTTLQDIPAQRDAEGIFQENCLAAGEPKFFQGGKRTQTPFCISNESMATPTEVAILDTILCGGQTLSLKAHFISVIPNISFLKDQLTSLNISFNNFVTLPDAILVLVNLEVLKARDNPLSVIPADICKLKNLKTLIISFCLLSTFPPQFFQLEMLENLDVSYNRLHQIPSQISHLRSLQELGVEGNQLSILPATILSLNLHYLGLKNNFLHHLFWQMTRKFVVERKAVKSLKELSAVVVYNQILTVGDISEEQEKQLKNILLTHCHHCHSAIGSNGLYDVQIHRNVFGHTALLLLHEACSLPCLEALR